ncbi:ImmA/IrrE family metallo-endopeptidase [Pectobacterium brasiliense]|uniref:ImmA/IrrE family metallo-endopeptidase n=1 Tax=Pectobacterium brasiliense TaxID=180957 RepID=UPI0025A15B71|nr:ImmA/IrrE family metallo-endopeptidase [Pectobacterium brasiliense]WJM82893.1 ImmA/IrrE family metallo-endopeptidase [Pectobacterium brasiliense]
MMPNTSADALLKRIWGERNFPVDPVWIANELGLDVVEVTLDGTVSGALLKEPEQDPVIILNSNDSSVRKRFTCAHELGHYIKRTENGQPLEYEFIDYRGKLAAQGVDADEMFANNFAACLLMPEKEMRRLHEEGYQPIMMASYFGVSDDAIRYRLKNLRLR